MIEPQITPEEAVSRAFRMVMLPSMAVLFVPIAVFLILGHFRYIPTYGNPGMMWALPTFFISFVGGWLVWSVQVPRWRLWAYRRVKDIQLLKELAVGAGIIWTTESGFSKTEIMSRAVREELMRLEEASGR